MLCNKKKLLLATRRLMCSLCQLSDSQYYNLLASTQFFLLYQFINIKVNPSTGNVAYLCNLNHTRLSSSLYVWINVVSSQSKECKSNWGILKKMSSIADGWEKS